MERQYTPACALARTTQCQRAAPLFIPKPLLPQPAQTVYRIGISDNPSVISCHVEDGPAFLKSPISAGKQQPSFTESSEPTTSPFNFERHSNIIQQLTKSPGDGFLFDSRPMFDSSFLSPPIFEGRGFFGRQHFHTHVPDPHR